jgi:nucleoside-diphosphate-sugar epimerase
VIAQSIAWLYAAGPQPHSEDDPLDLHADGARGITTNGVIALERLVLSSAPISGIVLRYGHLYGPDTGFESPGEPPTVHVDAAASAALLAIGRGHAGIYNVADRSGYLKTDKARGELGWVSGFRLS